MLEYVAQTVEALESDHAVNTRTAALRGLRMLGLDDFGSVLLSMPNPRFPKLARLLPAMVSDTVQRNWTGDAGEGLLRKSTAFVRTLSYNFNRTTLRWTATSRTETPASASNGWSSNVRSGAWQQLTVRSMTRCSDTSS